MMLWKKIATILATEFQSNVWKPVLAMMHVQLANSACAPISVHQAIWKNVKFFGNMKTINVSRIVMTLELSSLMIAKLVAMVNPSASMSVY